MLRPSTEMTPKFTVCTLWLIWTKWMNELPCWSWNLFMYFRNWSNIFLHYLATECTSTLISLTGGGQWFSFEFSVESCDFEPNGIYLKLEAEGEQAENVTAPPACLEQVAEGHYKFNSSNCTEVNLNLTPCTLYNVSVKTLFEECEPNDPEFQFNVWNERKILHLSSIIYV